MNYYKLDELCTDIIDCPHTSPKWLNEGIPVIRNFNLNKGRIDMNNLSFVDFETYKKRITRANPEPNDIIISREAPMGVVALMPDNFTCCLGQRLVLLKVNKEKVSPLYLTYALLSGYVQTQINRIDQTGSIVSNLNIPDLKSLIIPVPKNEQEIGKVLNIIDDKIANNNCINSELESMAKTIYDFWFTQFDFPDENGKPYKSSGGKMVWNEELKRAIPEGWKVQKLLNYIEFERGISYTKQDINGNKGIPMINLASVDINRNYKSSGLKWFSGEYKKSKIVSYKDLLIACTDLTRNADIIGSPILVPNDNEEYLYSMDLAKVCIDSKVFNSLYIYMTLRTKSYHQYIKGFASGTNVLHLNLDGVKWYSTFIPPIELQDKYGKQLENIIYKQNQILVENQQLSSLRDWLLPMLMNGQVGFKEVN